MDVLAFFSFVGLTVTAVALVGWWIVGPIDRAAKSRQAPVRFSLADFLCLFVAIQLPLAAIRAFVGDTEARFFWLLTIATWIVAPIIWLACARTLSKAGISSGRDRLVFMGLVLPVVYYFIFPFVLIPMITVADMYNHFALYENVSSALPSAWLAVLWLATLMLLCFCSRATRRMAARAGIQRELQAPDNGLTR